MEAKTKKLKPVHISQQNAGPMLTTEQYEKQKKLEKKENLDDRKNI